MAEGPGARQSDALPDSRIENGAREDAAGYGGGTPTHSLMLDTKKYNATKRNIIFPFQNVVPWYYRHNKKKKKK